MKKKKSSGKPQNSIPGQVKVHESSDLLCPLFYKYDQENEQ